MSRHERRFQLVGWLLFVVCAVLFIRSAMRSGDALYLAGSVVFLVACIAFILPLLPVLRPPRREGSRQAAGEEPALRASESLYDPDARHNHQRGEHADHNQPAATGPRQEVRRPEAQ